MYCAKPLSAGLNSRMSVQVMLGDTVASVADVRDGGGGVVDARPVVSEDEVERPVRRTRHDVPGRVDAKLVARKGLPPDHVDRIVTVSVLEADDERRAGKRSSTVCRGDHQVLVVGLLAGLPERLVLLVLEGNVDRAVRAYRRHRELVLVALTGRAAVLEGAQRGVRPGDLLRIRPGEAAVVAVGFEDRRGDVLARGRLELAPRQVCAAVERRGLVVVGDDPLLVVEQLRLAEVAADAVVDDDRLQPAEAVVA